MAIEASTLAVKVTSDGIQQASSGLSGLTTSARNAEKQVSALAQAFEKLEKASKTATGQAEAFNAKLMQQLSTLATLRADTTGLASSTASLAAAMAALSASLHNVNLNLNAASGSQRQHNAAMAEGHALARGLAGSLGALWVTYGNLAGMAVGLAIGFSLKGVIKEGMALENTLEGIRVKGNETVASIDAMRTAILDIGKGIYGPQKVAEAFEVLILAGLKAEQALVSVNAALNLATVGGISIEKSASALVSIGTAIGYTAEGFDRVADVIGKTAAISMSSVGTLTEAFKSASSVNALYGVSLEDIAVQLALLSNLGIQGSAAGTAVKNTYKELNSEAEKVDKTLKAVGININDIKTPDGKFRDFITVVKVLDEGLSKLDGNERVHAEERLTNERGLRNFTAAFKAYHTQVADGTGVIVEGTARTTNALQKMYNDVDNSYAFVAKGAIQMAMTTKNQFQSVANTLETVFAEVFRSIEPDLQLFAYKMKMAFTDPAFKQGLQELVKSLVGFTSTLISGIGYLAQFAGWLANAGKYALVLMPALDAAAKGWDTLNTAVQAGDKSAEMAKLYSDSYINGLIKEAQNLDNVTQKMKTKMSLQEASAAADRDESKQKMTMLDNTVIAEKLASLTLAKMQVGNGAGTTPGGGGTLADLRQASALKVVAKAQEDYNKAVAQQSSNMETAIKLEGILAKKSKERTDYVKEQAEKNKPKNGDDMLPGKPAKGARAAANDQYASEQINFDNEIKASRKELLRFEELANSQFKAGEIGRLQVIESVGAKSIEVYNRDIEAMKAKLKIAQNAPASMNKKADIARINGFIEQEEEKLSNATIKMANDKNQRLAVLDDERFQREIKTLEAQGKFVEAASMKYGEGMSIASKQIASDIAYEEEQLSKLFESGTEGAQERIDEILKDLSRLKSSAKALDNQKIEMIDLAQFKEDTKALDVEFTVFKNSIAAVFDYATAAGGIDNAINAAKLADDITTKAIPAVAGLVASLQTLMLANPENMEIAKAYEDADKKLKAMSEVGVKAASGIADAFTKAGDSIGNSMSKAFGKAGSAAATMLKSYTDAIGKQKKIDAEYQADIIKYPTKIAELKEKKDKESLENSLDMYAGMVGGAKNFFDEQSTAYKVLGGIEKAMYAVKFAMQAQAIIGNLAVGESGVASSIMQQGADALLLPFKIALGIANQANGDPYTAFARIAAMAGILAGVAAIAGVSTGGGSGGTSFTSSEERQKTQGTGSVFGDETAKSESISKSIDMLAGNSDITLTYTQEMLRALNSIRDNILGLVGAILHTTGLRGGAQDVLGFGIGSSKGAFGFSSSSTELIDQGIQIGNYGSQRVAHTVPGRLMNPGDNEEMSPESVYYTNENTFSPQNIGQVRQNRSLEGSKYSMLHSEESSWWGLSQSSSDDTIYKDLDKNIKKQMGLTVISIADGVQAAAEALGMGGEEVRKKIDAFNVDIGLISLKGLSGQALQDELNAVFSKFADDLSENVISGLGDFQKVGEGYFETVVRVASGIEGAKNAMERLGIQSISYQEILNKQGDVFTEISRQSIVRAETSGSMGTGGMETRGGNGTNGTANTLVTTGIGKIIEQSNLQGQDLIDLYVKLNGMRNILKNTGSGFQDITLVMVKAAGSIDALKAGMESYYENFFTEEERRANSNRDLKKGFDDLGIVMPTSKEGFKAIVNGIDMSTTAGQKLYAKLMLLAPAFAESANAADDVIKAQEESLRVLKETKKANMETFLGLRNTLNNKNLSPAEVFEESFAATKKLIPSIGNINDLLNMSTYQYSQLTPEQQASVNLTLENTQALRAYNNAIMDAISTYQEAVMRAGGATDLQIAEANRLAAEKKLTNSLIGTAAAAIPASHYLNLTTEELKLMTPEQIAFATSLVNSTSNVKKLTEGIDKLSDAARGFVNSQSIESVARSQIDNMKATTRSGLGNSVDEGSIISTQIAALNKMKQSAQEVWNRETNNGAYMENAQAAAARIFMEQANPVLAQLAASLAKFTAFEAANPGHGKELMDLYDKYQENLGLFQQYQIDTTELTRKYEAERLKIINGTLSAGLSQTSETLRKWMISLRLNDSLSPLTPAQKAEEARKQYMDTLTKANAGDKNAIGQITKDAETYLNAVKDVSGFGGNYSAVYAAIMKNIEDLAAANDTGGSGIVTTTVVTAASFAPVVAAVADTTAAVKVLQAEIVALKETLARTGERQIATTETGAAIVADAVVSSGDKTAKAAADSQLMAVRN